MTPPSPAVRGEATPVSQSGFRRRGTLLPDPRYDALRCIVLAAADDAEDMSDGNYTARVLLSHEKTTVLREGLPNVQVSTHAFDAACSGSFCFPMLSCYR